MDCGMLQTECSFKIFESAQKNNKKQVNTRMLLSLLKFRLIGLYTVRLTGAIISLFQSVGGLLIMTVRYIE